MAADDKTRNPIQSEPQFLGGFRQLGAYFKKNPVVPGLLVLVALLCGGAALTLNLNGYCYADSKFISTQEMFDVSIAAILAQSQTTMQYREPERTSFKTVQLVRYPDRESFLKSNPNCCALVPFNKGDAAPYVSLSQRIFGYAAGLVKVDYSVAYVDDDRTEKKTPMITYYVVTNCGRPWNAQH